MESENDLRCILCKKKIIDKHICHVRKIYGL